MAYHQSKDDVLVRVTDAGKVFCRDFRKSLLYGLRDSMHDLFSFRPLRSRSRCKSPQSPNSFPPCEPGLEARRLRPGEFWANQDINFELRRGECLGLIGQNGAGKTTLLKMLNGLIKPDTGRIEMRGKVAALIALGAGFNPLLTGRENVFVNASVLGLTRKEAEAKFEDIVAFAEVEEFIDAPVQSYSSGMQVRLGFAVATTLTPDVLIVDEVLAVGDLDFRMKCLARISSLLRSGSSIILVSHSMTDIQRICSRAIVMEHGQVCFDGGIALAISRYESLGLARDHSRASSSSNASVTLKSLTIHGPAAERNARSICIRTGDPVTLRGELQVLSSIEDARLRVFLESPKAGILCSISSAQEHPLKTLTRGTYAFEVTFPRFPFLVGAYGLGISVHGLDTTVHLSTSNAAVIEVIGPDVLAYGRSNAGMVTIPTEWKVQPQT